MSMILLFAFTLFTSAALLFWIQPLTAKMLLPHLGGAPAVWNICMVFFQSALLAGYLYVLAMIKWFSFGTKVAVHFVLLAAAAVLFFPFSISGNLIPSISAQHHPVIWGLAVLIMTIGLPFFVVSATSPLLQYWFSRSRHRSAGDPYFLFAASNFGSLIALLGFPLFLEPNLSLNRQGQLWAACYIIMAVLIAFCFLASRRKDQSERNDDRSSIDSTPVTVRRRLLWIAAAFIPSSLMLAVTQYISTDIAAVPLLWVIPLAIYLASFIIVFSRKGTTAQSRISLLLPGAVLLLTFIYLSGAREPGWFLIPVNLIFLFTASMVCHGRLADDRPHARHLVQYYIWIALGGMGGGIFNTLIAPYLFNAVLEYPLAIIGACFMIPALYTGKASDSRRTALIPFGILALTILLSLTIPFFDLTHIEKVAMAFGFPTFLVYLMRHRPVRFGLSVGAIMIGSLFFSISGENVLHRERNFFGMLKVADSPEGDLRLFYHGNTVHGKQYLDPDRRCEPLAYFHREGPLGDIFRAFDSLRAPGRVAGIGLGAGTMASYSKSNQQWTFYEIDPSVAAIAENEEFFTYLTVCAETPSTIILGDARLRIKEATEGVYGLIVLDAFSSDSIPVHLITEEAIELYFSKLAPGGMLAVHISNRNLDLRPVLAGAARKLNLKGIIREDREHMPQIGKDPSTWAVLVRSNDDYGSLADDTARWVPVEQQVRPVFWSDDFSNIISVLKWFR
jgi:hypothetical protein